MITLERLLPYLGTPYPAPGAEIRFDCPVCHKRSSHRTPDTKGHLYLNTAKKLFFCQRCEWKGSLKWLLQYFGLPSTQTSTVAEWADVVRRMSYFTGEDYGEKYDATEEIEYPCGVHAPSSVYATFRYLTQPKTEKFNGLSCRGLHPSLIREYQLREGAAGSWGETRVFIPTFHEGKMTFWVARDTSGTAATKYLNPTGRSRRYHIFNLDRAMKYRDVVITEGVFSAIAAGPNAVATFGKYVTGEQLRLLRQADFRTYYVALDGDAAAQAIYVAEWLQARGCKVQMVSLPVNQDPDSVEDFQGYVDNSEPYGWETAARFLIRR